jgi:flagellar basal-body rod protein FlgC
MSLFSALSISSSGLTAQRARAELIVENLANSQTTRTADGGPYRRKDAIFASSPQASPFASVFDTELAPQGVEVSQVIEDSREPIRRYQPGHPDADKNGYVSYPNINPAEDMVDLMSSSRGYQANVAAMSAVKDMIAKSIDLFRA